MVMDSTYLFLAVASMSLFSFLAVATWSGERRREREAYYRSETIRKIAEIKTEVGTSAIELLREEEKSQFTRRRESLKLGGLVTVSVGVGLAAFIAAMDPREPAYLVGLIPMLIGAAILTYTFFFAPKQPIK